MLKKGGHVLYLKIYDGRSVLKRDLRPGERLRFGISHRNDIVVFDSAFPKSAVFLENRGSSALLRIHPHMRGAVSYRDSTLDFRDLLRHELLPARGNFYLLTLFPGRTGTITLGETQVAFYFDGAVEMQPALPEFGWQSAWRRSLGKDLFFKVLLLVLLAGELFLGIHLRSVVLPPEEPPNAEQVPQRIARFVVRPPERPMPVAAGGGSGETASEPTGQRRSGAKERGSTGGSVTSVGLLGLIGGREGGRSQTADFLLDQGVARQLDELLSSTGVLQSRSPRSGGSTGGSGGGIDLTALSRVGAGVDELVGSGGVRSVELQKQGDVSIQLPQSIRSSEEARGRRTAESVMSVINAQRGRVMYTYNKYLRLDPELKGKVSFDVTIAADGRVSEVRVVESTIENAEFIAELTAILRGLKFPAIEAGVVTVNVPFVFHRTV